MFFKTFFKNYVYMMNLSLYIFGAIYITRGKLALMVGSTQGKPFGCGSSPHKVWLHRPHWPPQHIASYRRKIGKMPIDTEKLTRYRYLSPIYCVEVHQYSIFRWYIAEISWYFNHYFQTPLKAFDTIPPYTF